MKRAVWLILLGFLLAPTAKAVADCYAPIGGSGPVVRVIEMPGNSPQWANAFFHPLTGQPVIVYGPSYSQLPPLLKRFTRAHECCHLTIPTSDEIEPNCCAIAQLNLSKDEIQAIGAFMSHIPWLPPQYGGSGTEYWHRTRESCGID